MKPFLCPLFVHPGSSSATNACPSSGILLPDSHHGLHFTKLRELLAGKKGENLCPQQSHWQAELPWQFLNGWVAPKIQERSICAGFGAGCEQELLSRVSSVPGAEMAIEMPSAARRVNSWHRGSRRISSRIFGFVCAVDIHRHHTSVGCVWGSPAHKGG